MTIKHLGGIFGRNPTFNDVTIEGQLTFDGGIDINSNITWGDNKRAIFGTGSDLQIYHDGSNSYIAEGSGGAGTGDIIIRASNFQIQNGQGTLAAIKTFNGGTTELYHAGNKKLATTSTGVTVTGTVVETSDRNEKQDIEALSDAEQRVAIAAKGLLRKFRFRADVEERGDSAEIYFGIIAQDLQSAFEAEGLDANQYGVVSSTTWTDEETGEEHNRLGVHYSGLLAFIISAI